MGPTSPRNESSSPNLHGSPDPRASPYVELALGTSGKSASTHRLIPTVLSRLDRVVIAVCLCAALALAWVLATGRSQATSGGLGAIGQVHLTVGDVRRRSPSSLMWEELRSGYQVFNQDSVFAGPSSSITLVFANGNVLHLDAGTMVTLGDPAQSTVGPRVHLLRGGASTQVGGAPLVVTTNDAAIRLASGSSANLGVNGEHAIELDITEGSAVLEASGVTTQLASGQSANREAGGERPLVRNLPVKLLSPTAEARFFWSEAPQPVPLLFGGNPNEAVVLQVATSRAFDEIIHTAPAHAQEPQVFSPAHAGRYWWRVVDSKGAPLSTARSLLIVALAAPVVLSPRPDELMQIEPGAELRLVWSDAPGAAGYRMELATDPGFAKPKLARQIASAQVRVADALPEGLFHLRVASTGSDGAQGAWSATRQFRIVHRAVMDAPKLIGEQKDSARAPQSP